MRLCVGTGSLALGTCPRPSLARSKTCANATTQADKDADDGAKADDGAGQTRAKVDCPELIDTSAIQDTATRMVAAATSKSDQPYEEQEKAVLL
jgi:hypothetical protein